MELKEFIGSVIIAALFLLGVRMFSIAIPRLKEAFERIKELKKQIAEEKRNEIENEKLKYEALLNNEETVNLKGTTIQTKSVKGARSKRIENTICIDDIEEDMKSLPKNPRVLLERIRHDLKLGFCKDCGKELDKIEFDMGFCRRCTRDMFENEPQEKLEKVLCEVCEKPLLEEEEISRRTCNDCDDDEALTPEARNHVRTGDKNTRDCDWLDDLDEDEETYEGFNVN